MKVTRYKDRLLWLNVRMRVYTWHRIPVLCVLTLGKVEGPLPRWDIIVAMVAFQALMFAAWLWKLELCTAKW